MNAITPDPSWAIWIPAIAAYLLACFALSGETPPVDPKSRTRDEQAYQRWVDRASD